MPGSLTGLPAAPYLPAWPGAGWSPPHCQRWYGICHRQPPRLVPASWHWPSPHRGRLCPCQRCQAPAGRWCRSGSKRGPVGFWAGAAGPPPAPRCPTHLGQGHVGKHLHGQDTLFTRAAGQLPLVDPSRRHGGQPHACGHGRTAGWQGAGTRDSPALPRHCPGLAGEEGTCTSPIFSPATSPGCCGAAEPRGLAGTRGTHRHPRRG